MILWRFGLILLLPVAAALAGLVHKSFLGKATPGGNDNASGVAVLLQLARVYSRRRPMVIDLWMVFTGAGDAAGLGARNFLRSHKRELKKAYFLILDQVGNGTPVCYRREGRLIPFRANRRLVNMAKHVSDVHIHYHVGFKRNSLYLSEGYQLLSRGRRAMTISTRDKSRYPGNWRWSDDNHHNVDPRALRLSADFVQAILDNADRSSAKKRD